MKKLTVPGPTALKGKRILVTGGGSGFGRALALAFAAEGASVAVSGRRKDRLDATSRLSQGAVQPFACDARDPDQVRRLFDAISRSWGGLDGLVNNAGVLHEGSLLVYSLELWRETVETNLTGPFLITQAALPLFKSGGRIVNVTSGLGFFPMKPYNAYCVSKAGLNMLGRAFALELEDRDILVNTVDPGVAKTEMNPGASESPDTLIPVVRALLSLRPGGPSGKFFKKSLEEIPV